MGYTSQPFAIDIQKVKAVFGSKDKDLLEKIKTGELYGHYSSISESEYDNYLEDIIMNYIKPEDRKEGKKFLGLMKTAVPGSGLNGEGYEYGYALMAVCEQFGIFLAPEGDIFYQGNNWDEANELLQKKGCKVDLKKLWKPENIFDIPKIEDFPVIAHFSKEEVRELYKHLQIIEIDENKANIDHPDFDELHWLLAHLRNKLTICIDTDTEFLSFIH